MHRNPKAIRRPHAVPPRLQAVLGETEAALRGIYGGRAGERRHCSEAVAELSLRHDTVISLVPMGIEEFRSAKTPFLLNVRREGIRL